MDDSADDTEVREYLVHGAKVTSFVVILELFFYFFANKQKIIFIWRNKIGQSVAHLSWIIRREGSSKQVQGNFIIP